MSAGMGLVLAPWLLGGAAQAVQRRRTAPVPQPVIEAARGGQCVAEPAFMRRNHMKLLQHQRDDTLRGGIRTGQYSLKACIGCHANTRTGSVNASSSNFCQSCHAYAAVKIDCFECHASHAPTRSTAQARGSQAANHEADSRPCSR
ncbi:MAG: hypothetical protein IPO19_10750 [Rhodoferax sp.]|nr:hypothetical protein [Rhodoferax sp.]